MDFSEQRAEGVRRGAGGLARLPAIVAETLGPGLGEKLGEKLGETRAAIVQAMLDNSQVTTATLAKTLGISTTAVEKNIHYLKTNGYLERIGPAKGGHWKVIL